MRTLPYKCGLIVCLAWAVSCARPSDTSQLEHELGHTRNEPKKSFSDCRVRYMAQESYLDEILRHIVEHNADTFRDVYALEHLCIRLANKSEVNARSYSDSRAIEVSRGLILASKNDAELAAIVAHELAHITMQTDSYTAENLYPELAKDESFVATKNQIEQREIRLRELREEQRQAEKLRVRLEDDLVKAMSDVTRAKHQNLLERVAHLQMLGMQDGSDYSSQIERIHTDMHDLFQKAAVEQGRQDEYGVAAQSFAGAKNAIEHGKLSLQALEKEWRVIVDAVGGTGAVANWTEQQADEVGFELFLRAGFDPTYFSGIFWHFLSQEGVAQEKACRDYFAAVAAHGSVNPPERGSRDIHPGSCWRIHNVEGERFQKHGADYAAIMKEFHARGRSPAATVFPGQLEDLQKKLMPAR